MPLAVNVNFVADISPTALNWSTAMLPVVGGRFGGVRAFSGAGAAGRRSVSAAGGGVAAFDTGPLAAGTCGDATADSLA